MTIPKTYRGVPVKQLKKKSWLYAGQCEDMDCIYINSESNHMEKNLEHEYLHVLFFRRFPFFSKVFKYRIHQITRLLFVPGYLFFTSIAFLLFIPHAIITIHEAHVFIKTRDFRGVFQLGLDIIIFSSLYSIAWWLRYFILFWGLL